MKTNHNPILYEGVMICFYNEYTKIEQNKNK